MVKKRKVFVLGVDGATFDLILPWCRQGYLPHISKLLEDSSFGILKSTPEPNSAQAWSSFMTGLSPGNHGLYYFLRRKENSYDFEFANSLARDGKTIWKIAEENGKRCIVVNVPITFPPEKIDGLLISGMDAPGTTTVFTCPSGLYSELKREIGEYIIESDASMLFRSGKYKKSLHDLEITIDNRYKVIKYLMNKYPWELFTVVLTETDRVQHHFWRFMDRNHLLYKEKESEELKNAILKIYQKIDFIIGKIQKNIGRDTAFIIMSDHGAGPSSNRTVYINNWLHKIGLLHYKDEGKSNLMKLHYFRLKSDLMWQLHSVLKRTIPRGIKDFFRRYFPGMANTIRTFGHSAIVDWSKTKAYSTETTPNIRINTKGKYPSGIIEPGQEYEELRDHIIEKLRDLRDPENNNNVVGEIYKREEIYHGKYLDMAPDIIFRWNNNDYVQRFSKSAPDNETIQILSPKDLEFAERVSRPSGVHTPDGIVIMQGEDIKKNSQIKKAEITDLAPTILYLLGIPIPQYMDGRIISEAFNEVYLKNNQPIYLEAGREDDSKKETLYSDDEKAKIGERLRGLGYIE